MRCIWKYGPSSAVKPSQFMPSMIAATASGVERSTSVSSMRRMKSPGEVAGEGPGVQRGSHAADVQETGRAGRETGAHPRARTLAQLLRSRMLQ